MAQASYRLLQRPLITERATHLKTLNQYVFRVSPEATKHDIRKAIEQLFKVHVTSVNTLHVRGKYRRRGIVGGHQTGWKKAVVAVKAGQEIRYTDESK